MNASARRTTRESGFTLIEVMVALTLLGAVFAIIFGGLRFTSHASATAENRAERTEQILTSHRLLRRFLERAYPLSWTEGDEQRFAFDGHLKSLVLTALLPDYPSIAGPYEIKLYANKSKSGESLWLKLSPYQREPGKGAEPETIEDVILIPAPANIAFGYYGAPDDQGAARWLDSWNAEDRMPSLVRLSVRGTDDEAGAWPDLIVSIGIDMDVGCLFEPGKEPQICRLEEEEAATLREAEAGNASSNDIKDAKEDDAAKPAK